MCCPVAMASLPPVGAEPGPLIFMIPTQHKRQGFDVSEFLVFCPNVLNVLYSQIAFIPKPIIPSPKGSRYSDCLNATAMPKYSMNNPHHKVPTIKLSSMPPVWHATCARSTSTLTLRCSTRNASCSSAEPPTNSA